MANPPIGIYIMYSMYIVLCQPAFCQNSGKWDVTHVFFLGVGRDFVASAIKLRMAYLPGNNPDKLKILYDDFVKHASANGAFPSIEAFSREPTGDACSHVSYLCVDHACMTKHCHVMCHGT